MNILTMIRGAIGGVKARNERDAARDSSFLRFRSLPSFPGPDPERYGFIRTLCEKEGLGREISSEMMRAYADAVPGSRCVALDPESFSGARAVCLVGGNYGAGSASRTSLYAVTEAGLLISGSTVSFDEEGRRRPEQELIDLILGRSFFEGEKLPLYGPPGAFKAAALNASLSMIADLRGGMMLLDLSPEQDQKVARVMAVIGSMAEKRHEMALRKVVSTLKGAIDPEITRIMRSTLSFRTRDAEWLSGGDNNVADRFFPDHVALCAERSAYRMQAARSFPLMMHDFVVRSELTSAIDEGIPLIPVIADVAAHGMQPGNAAMERAVRSVSGVHIQRAACSRTEVMELIRVLASAEGYPAPRTRAEFEGAAALGRIACCARALSGHAQDLKETDTRRMILKAAVGGSPWRFAADLRNVSVSDLDDFAKDVRGKVLVPAGFLAARRLYPDGFDLNRAKLRDLLAQNAFMAEAGLSHVLAMNDRWHRNTMRHQDRLVEFRTSFEWDPALGEYEHKKIVAREIRSSEEAAKQGVEQDICIGSYDSKVIGSTETGITLLFTLTKGDETLSNLELFGEPDAGGRYKFIEIQNRSFRNGNPPREATAAARALVRHLSSLPAATFMPYLQGLAEMRERDSSISSMDHAIREAGYDFWDAPQFEAAFREMSAYLPKSVRRGGPEALIDLAMTLIRDRPEIVCASEVRPWDVHEEQISTFRRGERVLRVFLPEPEDPELRGFLDFTSF